MGKGCTARRGELHLGCGSAGRSDMQPPIGARGLQCVKRAGGRPDQLFMEVTLSEPPRKIPRKVPSIPLVTRLKRQRKKDSHDRQDADQAECLQRGAA